MLEPINSILMNNYVWLLGILLTSQLISYGIEPLPKAIIEQLNYNYVIKFLVMFVFCIFVELPLTLNKIIHCFVISFGVLVLAYYINEKNKKKS